MLCAFPESVSDHQWTDFDGMQTETSRIIASIKIMNILNHSSKCFNINVLDRRNLIVFQELFQVSEELFQRPKINYSLPSLRTLQRRAVAQPLRTSPNTGITHFLRKLIPTSLLFLSAIIRVN